VLLWRCDQDESEAAVAGRRVAVHWVRLGVVRRILGGVGGTLWQVEAVDVVDELFEGAASLALVAHGRRRLPPVDCDLDAGESDEAEKGGQKPPSSLLRLGSRLTA
jgi:hypothetical protein